MAITVSARKVIDVLRALPDASEVALSIHARKATITAGKSRVSLQTMAAEEFPQVLVQELFTNRLTVPQKAFKHLLSMVSYAMDTTRHPLLPKWTSLSHRGQETQACCDGWTPFGLLRYGS